jgi:UDP-glucose 4-epimerase
MRALVTGGAGFIGSYLIPELLEAGAAVVAFDLTRDPASLSPVADRITYVQGDLANTADLYRVMARQRITDVFHLGALLAGPCEDDPLRGFRVNLHSTQVLLDAAAALGVRRFVFLSSIAVFGRDVAEPVGDNALKNPETVYGQTKLAAEHLLHWYARRRGLDTRAVRFTWVFGPGRTTGITALYSSLILDAIARGAPVEVPNPEERGDWLYVRDAVKAIRMVWEAEEPGQRIFNIAGGTHSIREVLAIARRLRPEARISLAEGGANLSPYPAAYDDRAAREQLGWKPAYPIEAAVREHLEIVANRT